MLAGLTAVAVVLALPAAPLASRMVIFNRRAAPTLWIAPQMKVTPEPKFQPVTKAELLKLLQRGLSTAELSLATSLSHGDSEWSAGVRYDRGRVEAYRAAIEWAELLEEGR